MADQILPLEEHVKILLNGEMHQHPCDDIQENQILQDIPPWFDKEKFKRGQKYIMHNYMGQFAVAVSGLICVLAVPSILKILIKTQKSSTVESAYRRYVSTSFHVHSWYSDAFQPGSTSWKSLLAVRKRHLRASKGSLSKGGGHISQRDLVFTQFGFFGLGLLRAQWLGMATTDTQDLEGYLHFWRTIGYMIGIEDRYNICRPSVEETKHISQIICEEVYQKLLYNPPEHFYHMAKEMLEGLWYVDTSLSTKCYLYFTYWLVGVKGFTGPNGITLNALEEGENKNKYFTNGLLQSESSLDNVLNADKLYSAFSWLEKFKMYLIFIIYGKWLYSYIGRLYYNTSSLLTVYLTMYIPYTGFWRFGIKRSYVNMFKEDISIEGEVKTNKDVLAELYT